MSLLDEWRPTWTARAACAGQDGSLWFPVRGQSTTDAKTICRMCPVVAECLDYAITEGITHGIWGGCSTGSDAHSARGR